MYLNCHAVNHPILKSISFLFLQGDMRWSVSLNDTKVESGEYDMFVYYIE
jgi:hypothetical protein